MNHNISDFQALLSQHPAADHPFFSYLVSKAETGLNASEYQAFATNYIARTIFTIPEVAAAAYRSSTDLRFKGVSYGALTLNEEGGKGIQKKNHAVLMVKAINHHGEVVYGKDYKPVDAERILGLFRLMHDSANLTSIENLEGDITKSKFVAQLAEEKQRNVNLRNDLLKNDFSELLPADQKKGNYQTSLKAGLELMSLGVCKEVISYGIDQLKIIDSDAPGKIAGCAFAHEGLADNMMLHVFKIMYPQAEKYPGGKNEFNKKVYPYFSAHGDYKKMVKEGLQANTGDGVEAEHARREVAKIKEVISRGDEFASNAYEGAKDFADRQNNVWNGIMFHMQNAKTIFSRSI